MKLTIGENVKALRTRKGVTQEQLSEVLGVTCAAVSKWERGETYPDITLIFPLAYYFGVSVDELMGYNRDKVEEDVKRIVYEYFRERDKEKAKSIISEAYRTYPDNYRIMSIYMWTLGVEGAEPDLDAARANREELDSICDRILDGCTDGFIRAEAWKMKAILLHAEGKTDEALRLLGEKLVSIWNTKYHYTEQIFKKDSPEFIYWVKRNMYQLGGFAADKLSKSVFFDVSIPEEKRIADIEACGDALVGAYDKTGNALFVSMAEGVYGRLANDIWCRGVGTSEDGARINEKYENCHLTVGKLCDKDRPLYDAIYGQ